MHRGAGGFYIRVKCAVLFRLVVMQITCFLITLARWLVNKSIILNSHNND